MNVMVQAVEQGECEACLIVLTLDTQEQTTENKQINNKKTLQGLNKDGTTVSKVHCVKQGKFSKLS